MVGLREAVSNSVRGFVCSAFDISAGANRWLETLRRAGNSVPPPDPTGILPGAQALGCDPDFGGGQTGGTGTGVSYPPPMPEQGQCDAVAYTGSGTYERIDGLTQPFVIVSVYGPIEDVRVRPGSNRTQIEVICRGRANTPFPGSPGTSVITGQSSAPNFERVLTWTVSRVDGLPDDCGEDISSPYPTETGPITYDPPTGPPVTENVTIEGDDIYIDEGGNLIIPTLFIFPSFNLNVDLNFSTGEVNFNFGGEPGSELCCPTAEPEEDVEPDPEDPDPPMDRKRLVGIKVNTTLDPAANEATVIGQSGTKDLYFPDIGNVVFLIEIGGRTSYTEPQKLRLLSQFVAVNAPATAYGYQITARPGATYVVNEVIVEGTDES